MPAAGQAAAGELCLVGHCVHTLPIRAELDPEQAFVEHLQRVKAKLLDAFDHQRFTFGTLIKRLSLPRDPSRVPLIPVLFNLDKSIEGLSFSGLQVDYVSNPRAYESFELFVNATQSGEEIVLETTYNRNLFDAAGIQLRLQEFQTLLESIVRDPRQKLGDLALLPDVERQKLADWTRTQTPLPPAPSIAALVEAQVEATPDALAVSDESTSMTYRELDARANRLARQLLCLGVRPDDRVGVCLDRSVELVVAVLAVLKASASYVPLDPDFPPARLAFIADDARLAAVIAEGSVEESLPAIQAPVLWLDRQASAIEQQSADPLPRKDDPSRLAYVLHTSGSAGKPKGVEVPNGAVVNFLASMAREPGLAADDVLVAVTTLSFDIAGLELFLPLSVGARAVVVSRDVAMDGTKLCAALERYGATVMQATPSTWRLLLEAGFRGTPRFRALVGGEAFPPDLALPLIGRVSEVWNMYGPTETTIWSTCRRVDGADSPIPIGRPIDNTLVYVLDERHELVPIGVPGELYIGGAGVARGYFERPELTAERFVPSPFEAGGRLYRTGDLVRWTADGELVFVRRVDSQVKLRGYRVELGEVESVLAGDPRVRECVAVVREDRPGDQRLVAYVASDPASRPTIPELRARLEQALPGYMVPGHVVVLDALPRTPNQKIDRRALPAPDGGEASSAYLAPRTDVEQTLARQWAELLGLPRVGVNDDFFALGGHSMLAIRMLARVRDALGVDVGLRRLFRAPTVAGVAEYVEAVHLARDADRRASASDGEREEMVL
jgi:amino acid adenylation domain-containing protein